MNVSSLLELIAGAQQASVATVAPATGASVLPTFQASLLAAQNSANPFLKIPAGDSSNAGHLAKSTPEEKKSQPASSEPVTVQTLIQPQAPPPQQAPWLPDTAALLTTAPSQSLDPAGVTTVLPKSLPTMQGDASTLSPRTGQPVAEIAPVAVSAAQAYTAAPRSADHTHAVTEAPATNTTAPTDKHQAAAVSRVASADPGIAALQSVVTVANNTAPSSPAPEVAAPTQVTALNSSPRYAATNDRVAANHAAVTPGFSAVLSATPAASKVQPSLQQTIPSPVTNTIPRLPLDSLQQAPATGTHPDTANVEEAASPVTTPPSVTPSVAPQVPHPAPRTQDAAAPSPSASPDQSDQSAQPAQPAQPLPANSAANVVAPLIFQAAVAPITSVKTDGLSTIGKSSVPVVTNVNGQVSTSSGSVPASKQAVHAATAPAAAQSDAQSTSQQSDQSQGNTGSHAQTVTQSQASAIIQPAAVTEHAPASNILSPQQPPANLAGSTAHSANTISLPTATAPPLHQAPEVNTARLIQSAGQSEMRVGLRSSEFGDISIHTSTTRDLVSAQISLDHDELARTLATHLPEIQAKFGGTQPMEVRIDMNGQAAGQQPGQGQGTAGGADNGSTGNSHNHQQAKTSGASLAASVEPRASAGLANAVSLSADRRLDITV